MDSKLATIDDVADKQFDFVIIGGGIAGCVLANRLSENPHVSVALLEAGKARFNDPLIHNPLGWMKLLRNPEYDWAFPIKPQTNAKRAQQTIVFNRGKALGGSSNINLLAYTKPARQEMDVLELLGNPGWNWENFQKYSSKVEKITAQNPVIAENFRKLHSVNAIGQDGPISITVPKHGCGTEAVFLQTLQNLGLNIRDDTALNGEIIGAFSGVNIIDPDTGVRSSAAEGYILPILDRPNLKVLTEAYVENVVLSHEGHNVVAQAVEFEHGGKSYQVRAAKEIVLSAGGIKTPQILEVSGIGNPKILKPLGIKVHVDLPSVGENIQEHVCVLGPLLAMDDTKGLVSAMMLEDPAILAKLYEPLPPRAYFQLTLRGYGFVPLQHIAPNAAEIIEKRKARFLKEADNHPPGTSELIQHQLRYLEDEKTCDVEIMLLPFRTPPGADMRKPCASVFSSLCHPLSRGTIHITSKDPKANPEIDPRYFDDETDLDIMAAAFSFCRKISQTEPFKSFVQKELIPGPAVDSSPKQAKKFASETIGTVWHTCGACSMLPRDNGGVVDPKLKVYGTKNLRVVDLSILPLMVANHTQSVVYGMAEQAADIIKADWGLPQRLASTTLHTDRMEEHLAKVDEVVNRDFDFVIIGGGTAGCVLANRLTEDKDVTVAVLEAGSAHYNDPNILEPIGWMTQMSDPAYDYYYETVPQEHAENLTFHWTRGKGLGGSSAINCLGWTRPARQEMDALETLGNKGWNWDKFFHYSKKSERFIPPYLQPFAEFKDLYNAESLGHDGPISLSFAKTGSGAEWRFQKSLANNGVPITSDFLGGNVIGTAKGLSDIDPATRTRVTADIAYIWPVIQKRHNLKILTEARVHRVRTVRQGQVLVAEAVEFEHGGQKYQVSARKEVILSAGAIESPHILELSGIGDHKVLEPLEIPVQLDLPSIGINVQDRIIIQGPAYRMADDQGIVSANMLSDPAVVARLDELHAHFSVPFQLTMNGLSFLPIQMFSQNADKIIQQQRDKLRKEWNELPSGLQEQYNLQLQFLADPHVPDMEIVLWPFLFVHQVTEVDKPYIAPLVQLSHLWTRGTIHSISADPTLPPAIDPHYLDNETDMSIFVEAFKFVRKVCGTEPFKSATVAEVMPGSSVQSDEEIKGQRIFSFEARGLTRSITMLVPAWVKRFIHTTWHTCGSLAMLPREKGGVVDEKLKIYGTKNIRVVDLSVMPLQIAVHTQALVYAIAEQGMISRASAVFMKDKPHWTPSAADIIRADFSKT
ncbi:hypothetical protein NM688_g5603 [Phlebia brevispora]|uniref:Uncharacterized protein n=1 Tax=Phlebia brevispora TaxID=194682 RepID=A0ACC1SSR3_9APHY|nr:hypothetical protein NM688_g5603 [Phlebia brevispora]